MTYKEASEIILKHKDMINNTFPNSIMAEENTEALSMAVKALQRQEETEDWWAITNNLEEINLSSIEKSIKHFEGLQKRYTTQHNGEMCQMVECALDSMKKRLINEKDETTLDVIKHNTSLEMAYFIEKMYKYIEEGKFKTTNDIQDYLDRKLPEQDDGAEYDKSMERQRMKFNFQIEKETQ